MIEHILMDVVLSLQPQLTWVIYVVVSQVRYIYVNMVLLLCYSRLMLARINGLNITDSYVFKRGRKRVFKEEMTYVIFQEVFCLMIYTYTFESPLVAAREHLPCEGMYA